MYGTDHEKARQGNDEAIAREKARQGNDDAIARVHGERADALIAREVALQDAMWGVANERSDVQLGQMTEAATAHCVLVHSREEVMRVDGDGDGEGRRAEMLEQIRSMIYPRGWSGFRDYGSPIANLVVAGAYLRQEIKRRLMLGEDATRADRPRDQPYTEARPNFTTADPDWETKVRDTQHVDRFVDAASKD